MEKCHILESQQPCFKKKCSGLEACNHTHKCTCIPFTLKLGLNLFYTF